VEFRFRGSPDYSWYKEIKEAEGKNEEGHVALSALEPMKPIVIPLFSSPAIALIQGVIIFASNVGKMNSVPVK